MFPTNKPKKSKYKIDYSYIVDSIVKDVEYARLEDSKRIKKNDYES